MKEERLRQVESLVKTKVDAIIRSELNDPRLALMSIVHVKVSKELDTASIFVSHPGDEKTRLEVEKILRAAAGFIEVKLRNAIRLRRIPKLNFRLDDSMIHAARIDELLDSIKNDSENNDENDNSESDDADESEQE